MHNCMPRFVFVHGCKVAYSIFEVLILFQILPTMWFEKRKRTAFTLKEKKEIIDAAKKEPNQSKLAR